MRPLALTFALLLGAVSLPEALAQNTGTRPTGTQTAAPAPATSLSLADALARLGSAPQVVQANLALNRAQRDLDAAQAGLSLNVTVGGNASYSSAAGSGDAASGGTDSGGTGSSSGSSGLNGSLNLKATAGVLPWASNRTALAAAQRSLNYAKAVRQENINSARSNVVQQYQSAYLAQLDLQVAAQNLQSAQQTLSAVQLQRSQQNATQESELQAQASLQTAQASQQAATAALDTARRSLSATLGTDLTAATFDTPPSLPASLDAAGLTTLGLGDVNALVAQAIANSSDVVQARNTLASAQDTLAEQQRNRTLPDLTLSANYGPGGSGLGAGLSLRDGTANVGYTQPLKASSAASSLSLSLSGSYTVYGPAANAQIASTQAQVSQAELSLTLARQTAELAVRQQYGDTLTALGAVTAKVTLEQRADVALQTARARLAAGTGTQNDVTSAEAADAQARRDTQAARAAAALSILKLQLAAGGPQ
ncbi:TolC family protein [Deinococcus alpinitundrae]|uniref:TolC family protein n=1 Tax=Deinococcus alpinitundrae TaxID=468913 RepID=UPI00137A431C|nr:TolC family protein [Deinococcus alpinitundrae]